MQHLIYDLNDNDFKNINTDFHKVMKALWLEFPNDFAKGREPIAKNINKHGNILAGIFIGMRRRDFKKTSTINLAYSHFLDVADKHNLSFPTYDEIINKRKELNADLNGTKKFFDYLDLLISKASVMNCVAPPVDKIAEKYDLVLLAEVCRSMEKNPARFTWDESKEYLDYEDIVDLLRLKENINLT